MSSATAMNPQEEVIEIAKNSTGNRFGALLIDVDDPARPEQIDIDMPHFVEIIFTRPDGVELRKRGDRPLQNDNAGDDNEIFYINRAGDGVADMYGPWRYTAAYVTSNGLRVRSRESVPFWVVRGDDEPVGAGDEPPT